MQSEEALFEDNMVQLREFQLQPHFNLTHRAIDDRSKRFETGMDSKRQKDSPISYLVGIN